MQIPIEISKKITYMLAILLFAIACGPRDLKEIKAEVIGVDLEFSAYSEKMGVEAAFSKYAHEDGIMLRDNSLPVVGREAIGRLMSQFPASATLTWEPVFCDVSSSGDLAYTYGTYQLLIDTLLSKGTYVSIWKKTENGEWRFVLDTGNEGIGSESPQ